MHNGKANVACGGIIGPLGRFFLSRIALQAPPALCRRIPVFAKGKVMWKKFLTTPARRLSFIVSIPLAIIAISYFGGMIVQALTSETGTTNAIFLAWLFLALGAASIFTAFFLMGLTWYLFQAMLAWIKTGRWPTPYEWADEDK